MTPDKAPGQKNTARKNLSAGFRDVDTSGDTDAYTRCLDLLAGIPFFHAIKEDSIHMIAKTRPDRVLDAGCGSGIDLCALARHLPADCSVAGLDISTALLATAAERTAPFRDRCLLFRGDLARIPCRAGSFSACRIDRVLQHTADPALVIRELVRITRPGGTLVAYDNDWDTLSLDLDDAGLATTICRFWSRSFASGRAGHDLERLFRECGLAEIRAEPRTLVLTDRALAEQVLDFPHLLGQMENAGILSHDRATAIRSELCRRDDESTFAAEFTGFVVTGKKPDYTK